LSKGKDIICVNSTRILIKSKGDIMQCPKTWKRCTTCEYWGGIREYNQSGRYVVVESEVMHGKCLNSRSGRGSNLAQASYCCSQYRPWGVMK